MKKPVTGLLAIVFLTCLPAIGMGATVAGRTAGVAEVSLNGQATYSISLFVPPGTNGMTPKLSLNYNHGSGEGLFGVGWSMTGFSGVTRCNSTWAQDGIAREVRNDAQDKFCLDGQKLRLVSGVYGDSGSTYSTEIESFARITANGSVGNGPASFTVETRDGLVYEYGGTSDSQIESVGQTSVRFWAVSRIRDRSSDTSGNAIAFAYLEDTTNGSFRPSTIQYAQNTVQGIAAPYQVQFFYDNLPAGEVDSNYANGSLIKRIVRATRMDITHSSGALVRRYYFNYEASLSSTAKSRLESIQECAGLPTTDCFSKTVFSYQNGTKGLGAETVTSGSIPVGLLRPIPMDINGDGKEDIVWSSTQTSGTGTWYFMLGNSSGTYGTPINTGVVNTNFSGAITIDFNADGLEDLLVPYSGGTWWVMFGSASGLQAPSPTGAAATGTGLNAHGMDVNGDGLDDLVWADLYGWAGGDVIRYRANLNGSFSSTATNLITPLPAESMITSGVFQPWGRPQQKRSPDFNGDGRADITYQKTQRIDPGDSPVIYIRTIQVVCPGGTNFGASVGGGSTFPMYMDLNGDGRSDLVYSGGTTQLRYRFSTGKGFTPEYFGPDISAYSIDWVMYDWDSDGREDLLAKKNATNHLYLFRSTGEGWEAGVDTGIDTTNLLYMAVTDINGDNLPDVAYSKNNVWASRLHVGVYPDLLTTAADGYSNAATFVYASIANYSDYLKRSTAVYPQQESARPYIVVSSLTQSDGIGGTFTFDYQHYEGARFDLQGRGFLGFAYRAWRDHRDDSTQRRTYLQTFPYIGAVSSQIRTRYPDNLALEETQTTFLKFTYGTAFETRYMPYPSQITQFERQVGTIGPALDGALLTTITTTNAFDSTTGVLYDRVAAFAQAPTGTNGLSSDDGITWRRHINLPVANFQNSNDATHWCKGRPGTVIIENWRGSAASTQRTTSFTWDTAKCRRTQEITEPLTDAVKVITDWSYDNFGNVSSTAVSGPSFTTRTTATSFVGSVNGQFPTSQINAEGNPSSIDWDYALGLPSASTDPNGTRTDFQYDVFGRTTRETRAANDVNSRSATGWSYNFCTDPNIGCFGANNKTVIIESDLDNAFNATNERWFYRDKLDRSIAFTTKTASGQNNRIERRFDQFGQLIGETTPCFWVGCTQYWSTQTFDLLHRPTNVSRQVSEIDSAIQNSKIFYEGLTTRFENANLKSTKKVRNAVGEVVQAVDEINHAVAFTYDDFSNVMSVIDSAIPSTALQTATYNASGMLTGLTDMDRGSWTYQPNALGEVEKVRDAKTVAPAWTTTFQYDRLGRITSRGETEGSTYWLWGDSNLNHNIGSLVSVTGPGYSESYLYDSIGRLSNKKVNADVQYQFDYGYNASGLLDTLTYPESTTSYRLKTKYEYANGQLVFVKDANNPSTIFWALNGNDPGNQPTAETLLNTLQPKHSYDAVTGWLKTIKTGFGSVSAVQDLSYAWSKIGSLVSRADLNQGTLTESFAYDDASRLLSATLSSGPSQTLTYDVLGNISSNSLKPDGVTSIGSYTYDSVKRHQLSSTQNGWSFSYDLNGNAFNHRGMTIVWSSYNYPLSITGSGVSSTFNYTFDRRKYRQDAAFAVGGSSTTIYVDDLLEKVTNSGITDYRYQIVAGSSRIVVSRPTSAPTSTYYYFISDDHLGSSSTLTYMNTATAPVKMSFGPFGNRRGSNWQGFPTTPEMDAVKVVTRTGFTGHTMLDNLGLIHMRGRVEDPALGRFVSVDPVLTDPLNPQSYNPYSYVVNDPLSLTDPSGFDWGDVPSYSTPGWSPRDFWTPTPRRPPAFVMPCANHCVNPSGGVRTPPPMQAAPCDFMSCGGGTGVSAIGFGPDSDSSALEEVRSWICSVGIAVCGSPIFAGAGPSIRPGMRPPRVNRRVPSTPPPRWVETEPGRPNYRNIPGGSLAANDALDGRAHTTVRHVGRDVTYLRERLQLDSRLATVSTFYTVRSANQAVEEALSSPQGQGIIRRTQESGLPGRITYSTSRGAGMTLARGDALPRQGANRVTVVIIPSDNPQSPGFVVLTAMLEP